MTDTRYTHGHHESVLRSHRWRTVANSAAYLAPYLQPGATVLDVGCGPGNITIEMAGMVAPARVIGVDAAAGIIAAAQADATAVGNLRFEVDDAYALSAADATFDVVHAHQVLQHLVDPVKALAEWNRVCRPGGVVAARDADYAAMTWYPKYPLLDRWNELYHAATRANRAQADAGRRLLAWAHEAGFTDVAPTASVWCFATPEDRQWWGGLWADRVTTSAFGDQLRASGMADDDELAAIGAAWRAWAQEPDGWFLVPHGEIICRA